MEIALQNMSGSASATLFISVHYSYTELELYMLLSTGHPNRFANQTLIAEILCNIVAYFNMEPAW